MGRSAENTIKGFFYQIHKTLLEILRGNTYSRVTAEGPIEDIEIVDETSTEAIQCKYHEAKKSFSLSQVFKPLLQMMEHFHENPDGNTKYRLFAYFPGEQGELQITKADLETVLNTKSSKLQNYVEKLKGNVDLDGFLTRFTFEFGQSYDDIIRDVKIELNQVGLPQESIDTLIYPNAINEISELSIQKYESQRHITKSELLNKLRNTHRTAISRWTYALQTKKKILETRKRQIRNKLDQNSQLRCFLISTLQIKSFVNETALFIREYLDRYHIKIPHDQTPIFGIDCSEEDFESICKSLYYVHNIKFNDGLIARDFDKQKLLSEPLLKGKLPSQRDFRVALFRYEWDKHLYESCGNAYLFVIGQDNYDSIDFSQAHVEYLAVQDFRELKFILRIADDFQ